MDANYRLAFERILRGPLNLGACSRCFHRPTLMIDHTIAAVAMRPCLCGNGYGHPIVTREDLIRYVLEHDPAALTVPPAPRYDRAPCDDDTVA